MPPFLPLQGTLSGTADIQYFSFAKTAPNPGSWSLGAQRLHSGPAPGCLFPQLPKPLFSLSVLFLVLSPDYLFQTKKHSIYSRFRISKLARRDFKQKTLCLRVGGMSGSRTSRYAITGLGAPKLHKGFGGNQLNPPSH